MGGTVSGAEFLGSKESRPEFETVYVDIWPEFLNSIDIFSRCQLSYVAGPSKIRWLGISSIEVKSALELADIDRAMWPEISQNVQYMASIVCTQANQ